MFSDDPGAPISYYATMADNTPLPAWVSFDPGSLTFTGRTPPSESLVQPPQHFAFRVIASDVPGFAGASLSFDIVVGNHQLTADETKVVLSATPGIPVSYTGLRSRVKVDGKPATAQTASIVSASNLPSWLFVDKDTWHITGIPPETAESTNFTVTIRDTYSNVLNMTVAVEVTDDKAGLFKGGVPEFTITAGEPFSFDLRPYLSEPEDTDVSIEVDSSHSWIQFNPGTSTLFGDAPEGLQDSAVDVKINAKSKSSKESVSLSFSILIRAASDGKGSSPTSDPTTGATDGQRSSGGDGSGKEHFNPVLLAVLLPLLVLLALATCALFWYFRRRKDSRRPALSTRDVSGPIAGTFVARIVEPSASRSLPDLARASRPMTSGASKRTSTSNRAAPSRQTRTCPSVLGQSGCCRPTAVLARSALLHQR
jgi:axial budding pattern protein 2